jgi:DNA-binding FrmR family transcriptional regulator
MEYNDQMKNRVKRIEGQLRGILRMMDENKDCKEVITQLSATRTAIDRTIIKRSVIASIILIIQIESFLFNQISPYTVNFLW